jgi:CheY-like chemotaxis protein
MEAIGILAGGIAHDFNNLLQVILGHSEVLLAQQTPVLHEESPIQVIANAARRGSLLAKQLLTFSSKGTESSRKQPVLLNQIVADFLTMLNRVIPKSVSVTTRLDPSQPTINADASQIEQVLMNLSMNATQAMPEGGTLTIETQLATLTKDTCFLHADIAPGEHVLLTISDTGQGMDPETLERIYLPFFTTKDVGKGTGLGLSVVYGVVKDHQGLVRCESRPGKGTTFRIYLPKSTASAAQSHPTEETSIAPSGNSETVLLVDDDTALRNLVQEYLTKQGYCVIPAGDGLQAVLAYQSQPDFPKLVVLDLGMPGMSGWDCLQQLRSLDPNAKILVATGYGGEDIRTRALEEGAKGIVNKPYALKKLSKKVREILKAA